MMIMYCDCNYHGKRKAYSMEIEEGIPRYKAYALMGTAILTKGHPGLTELEYDENRPCHMMSIIRGSVLSVVEKFFVLFTDENDKGKRDETLPSCPQFFKNYGVGAVCVYWNQWEKFREYAEKRKKPMIFKQGFENYIKNLQTPL